MTADEERATFEQWARKQWNSFTVSKRADRFVEAYAWMYECFHYDDDFGMALLAGALFPLTLSPDQWRELIRARVVYDLWYEWNRMQVVAEGLIGTDDEIQSAAVHRSFDKMHCSLTDAVEGGDLNHVVTYHISRAAPYKDLEQVDKV
jgi:hypothetical protein